MLLNLRAVVLAGLGLLITWNATPAAGSAVGEDGDTTPNGVFLDLGAAPGPAIAGEGTFEGIQATRPKTASFEIEYQGFPTAARQAFDAAADIWAGYLVSSVPIRIDARWEPLTEHVLGQHVQRFAAWDPDLDSKLPLKGVLYPYSLAQAIGGKRTNLRADTTITLNSTSDWYMGTDGPASCG